MSMTERVPSPADAPQVTARHLLAHVRRNGGRVFRMREEFVFVITENRELADYLLKLGARPYLPRGMTPSYELGSFRAAKDSPLKWDVYIHSIPVRGPQTVWEAAGDAEIYEVL